MDKTFIDWANRQVANYERLFDIKLNDYIRHGGDTSQSALLTFADTSHHYKLQEQIK